MEPASSPRVESIRPPESRCRPRSSNCSCSGGRLDLGGRGRQAGIYHRSPEAAKPCGAAAAWATDFSAIRPRARRWGRARARAVRCPTCRLRRPARRWNRRGAPRAQMGVLRLRSSDVEEFIHAKDQETSPTFNISCPASTTLHAGGRGRRQGRPGAQSPASRGCDRGGAHQREDGPLGVRDAARPRALGPDHALDLRSRRARDPVHRPHEQRQQSQLLRGDRGTHRAPNNLCRPTAGCCLARSTHRFVSRAFSERAAFDYERFGDVVEVSVRMLDNCSTSRPGRSRHSTGRHGRAPRGLGFTPRRRAYYAAAAIRQSRKRVRRREISRFMRDTAYRASSELGRSAARSRFSSRTCISRVGLRRAFPPSSGLVRRQGIRNSHLSRSLPRHHPASRCRQRLERHRATLLLDLHAEEAHGRRDAEGIPVEDYAWRLYKHDGGDVSALPRTSSLRSSSRPPRTRVVAAVAPFSIRASPDGERAETTVRDFQALLRGMEVGAEGLATDTAEQHHRAVLSVAGVPVRRTRQQRPQSPHRDQGGARAVRGVLALAGPPNLAGRNPAWTYMIEHRTGSRALRRATWRARPRAHPFERG